MRKEALGKAARVLVAASRWLFGPAALLFLIVAGWRSRSVFAVVIEQTEVGPLLIAIALWALLHLLAPVLNRMTLHEAGSDIRYGDILRIHVGRLPARYLPGGIWHTVSRVMDLRQLGASRLQLSIMVLLENTLSIAVAVSLGSLCLSVAGGAGSMARVLLPVGPLLLACIWWLLHHRRLRPAKAFSGRGFVKLVALTLVFWLLAASAFYCYWQAFPGARESASALQIYGVYMVAWATGFIAVFAPQGIGVFESVAGYFLQGALTFAGAAVLAAGFRIVVLAADMLAFALLLVAVRLRGREPDGAATCSAGDRAGSDTGK